jgi:hypothetical protein
MCLYRILRRAIKLLYLQILLYRLEKKFNMPAFPVNRRYLRRAAAAHVREQHYSLAGFRID